MYNPPQDNPGVIALPPLIYAAALVIGLLLDRVFPAALLPAPWTYVVAVPLGAGALLISGSAHRVMRRAGTNIDTRKPATALVTAGPFRFTRNPLYLSLTLLYSAIAFAADDPWLILLLPAVLAVIRYGVIAREERYLEGKFGEDYRRYKAAVRRWV